MNLNKAMRQQLINNFKIKQSQHVQKINHGLLVLEKNPTAKKRQALLDEIFCEACSLKEAARAVGMTTIESQGHAMSELFLSVKEGRLTFSPRLLDLFYQTLDAVEIIVEQVESTNLSPLAVSPDKTKSELNSNVAESGYYYDW